VAVAHENVYTATSPASSASGTNLGKRVVSCMEVGTDTASPNSYAATHRPSSIRVCSLSYRRAASPDAAT
jgi:hypothetical protein